MKQRDNLARPRDRQAPLGVHYNADAFGKFSESIARLMGTARFLIIQTILVIIWIINIIIENIFGIKIIFTVYIIK